MPSMHKVLDLVSSHAENKACMCVCMCVNIYVCVYIYTAIDKYRQNTGRLIKAGASSQGLVPGDLLPSARS